MSVSGGDKADSSNPVEVRIRSWPRAPNTTVSMRRPLSGWRMSDRVCATRSVSLAEAMLESMPPSSARMPILSRRSILDIDRAGVAGEQVKQRLRHRQFAAGCLVAGAKRDAAGASRR